MAEKVIDRIEWIISHYNLSNRAFDLSIGKSNGYIGKQIDRKASIGSDTLETILHVYDDISPQWLIAGEGSELRSQREESSAFEEKATYETDLFEIALLKYLDRPRVQDKIKNIMNDEEGQKSNR